MYGMKESKSKWSRIVHNFMNSGLSLIRLYEPNHTENVVICLKHYLDGKNYPIAYAKRYHYIYIFRTDCLTLSVEQSKQPESYLGPALEQEELQDFYGG